MRNLCGYTRGAIYEALNGRISYGGNYVPVYSSPPQALAYPCIVIGEQNWETENYLYEQKILNVTTTIYIITRPGIGAPATYQQADAITSLVVDNFEDDFFINNSQAPGSTNLRANNIELINGYIDGGSLTPVIDNDGLTIQSKISLTLKFEEDKQNGKIER